jgi:AmmeMemoRadiSam system protein A
MLSQAQRLILLDTAWRSIEHGLQNGSPLPVEPGQYDAPLGDPGACFVTLHENGELRGCIGSLEAHQPLVRDVSDNAYSAAFRDPRFRPVQSAECGHLSLDISVLSVPEPVEFTSEQDLLEKIRPGIDGLILQDDSHRGTFLPSVWESLPDARRFLQHLKLKAGLAADYWSNTLRVWRYSSESFGD